MSQRAHAPLQERTPTDAILDTLKLFLEAEIPTAKVWPRGELPDDEDPEDLALYLEMLDPVKEPSNYRLTFMNLPIAITAKFNMRGYGKHDDDGEDNVVDAERRRIYRKLQTIMKRFPVSGSLPEQGTSVYHVEAGDTSLTYTPPEDQIPAKAFTRRLRMVWNFHTAEDLNT